MPEPVATDANEPADLTPNAYRWLLVVAAIGGLWLTHVGLTSAVPAGTDIEAHVARTDFALDLFRSGRLDGWFPTFGSGYRLFAVYGPGLAIASGLVQVLSFGMLDTPQSLAVLGSVSIAVLPAAVATLSRELGSTRRVAVMAGVLALFVSAPLGGGLAGLYGLGLLPQAVAMPVQVLTAAGIVRVARTGSTRVMAATALGVGWLLVLHPISLLVLMAFAPGLLLAVRPWTGTNVGRVALAGLWAAAISALWLVPALRTRGLRGGLSASETPRLGDLIGDVAGGRALFPQVVAIAAAAAFALVAGQAIRDRSARRWLIAPTTAVVYLLIAHFAVQQGWAPDELWVQFPNRGLALAGCLLLLPLARVLGDAVGTRPEPVARNLTVGVIVFLLVAAPILLSGPRLDPRQDAPPPSADLAATSETIGKIVPESARHLLVEPSPFVPLGTAEPTRWLAVASGRNTAQLFFAEATRSVAAGDLPARVLAEGTPSDWLGPLRRAGITHIVATAPIPATELDGEPGYERVARHGSLEVYAVGADPGSPAVSALLQPDAEALRPERSTLDATLVDADPERYTWTVVARHGASNDTSLPHVVVAPVAFDPAWVVEVDGERVPVTASNEDLVRFKVPEGEHRVVLRFTGSRNDPIDIAISLVAISAAGWTLIGGRQRFRAHQAEA